VSDGFIVEDPGAAAGVTRDAWPSTPAPVGNASSNSVLREGAYHSHIVKAVRAMRGSAVHSNR
jgi:hypothetical protein